MGNSRKNFKGYLRSWRNKKIMYTNLENMCSLPIRNFKHSFSIQGHIFLKPPFLVCECEFGVVETHVNWILSEVCVGKVYKIIKSEKNSLGTLTISNISCQRHQLLLQSFVFQSTQLPSFATYKVDPSYWDASIF